MNYMKKILTIAALAVIPMLAAIPAQALPLFNGTVNLNFSTGGSTTLDWAVYSPGNTGALAGVNATDYTYQYTLHGWSGFPVTGNFFSDIGMTLPATGVGSGVSGTTSTVTTSASPFSDFYQGSAFFFDTHAAGTPIDFTSATSTTTGWYTSALGPVDTWIAGNLTGAGNPTTYTAGQGLDGQKIMGAGTASIVAIPNTGGLPGGVPGVPEPETWALLLAMMGFTMVWMRRRQDDDAPLETTIAA
ncbi:MAG: PEP-CTERM sorting domain-containing protein [Mariprofundaceae bacterium]|nr:PEP-CTERM sorting domain-containing protein [Mariprofundaceae bacterium]